MPSSNFLFSKGQASVEYVVILSLVLLLGTIVLAVSGFFPSFSYSSQIGDSSKYWQSTASPLAIIDSTQSSTTLSAVLENRASANIKISSIVLTHESQIYTVMSFPSIPPGGKYIFSLTGPSCNGQSAIAYLVQINYDTDSVASLVQKGIKPLYVQCSG